MASGRLAGITISAFIGAGSQLAAQTVDVTDQALRRLFEDYYFGQTVPKNQAIAERYLRDAAQSGSEWAILLVAQKQERSAPVTALEAYLRLARNNNCAAQQRLVDAYASGILVKKNLTQAYFWSLLARANQSRRRTDVEYYGEKTGFNIKAPDKFSLRLCIMLVGIHAVSQGQLEKVLPPKLIQLAQDSATKWSIGEQEKLLPAPELPKAVVITTPKNSDTGGSNTSPKLTPPVTAEAKGDWVPAHPSVDSAVQIAKWTPLAKEFQRPELKNKQTAEELFVKTRYSVWVVIAANAMSQNALSHVSQGSAIAISDSYLLTNYHVIDGQRFVFIKQGDKVFEAIVVSGDKQSDRSMLQVKGGLLSPVAGLRGFGKLRVGEEVYTIGSPNSLESTLGQGIVSGLRIVAGQHLVQTTAPISPGSSGGGLFDSAGNLIGITSFVLKNSQGLNFAIAADDYFR